MMSLQLGETFSGLKTQRPVQWVCPDPKPSAFQIQGATENFLPPWYLKACYSPGLCIYKFRFWRALP